MSQPSGFLLEWFHGCDNPEDKKKREELIRGSSRFIELLQFILSRKYETIDRKGMREEDYAETGWVTLQAFRNGKLAMLEEINQLFSNHPDKGKE